MITQTHIAEVTNNNDPEQRGRIKVKCPGLVRSDRELPQWIEPVFPFISKSGGWFFVPEVGTQVELEVVTSARGDERRDETSLLAPTMRYRAALYNEAQPLPDTFKTNYPKRRGLITPSGHYIFFDDTSGSEKIEIRDKNGNVVVMNSSGVKITDKDGHYVEWTATGISIDGTVPVVRNGDTVTAEPGMITWMSQVAAICNALVPGGVSPPAPPDFGKAVASSTKVGSG